MTSTVFSDLIQADTLVAQQTEYNCSSDNCTWDIFQSLAICSVCTDLTDRFTKIYVLYIGECFRGHVNSIVYRLSNGLRLIDVSEVNFLNQ